MEAFGVDAAKGVDDGDGEPRLFREPARWYARRAHDHAFATFAAVWGVVLLHVVAGGAFFKQTESSDYDWLVGTDPIVQSSYALTEMQNAAADFATVPERSVGSETQMVNFVFMAQDGVDNLLTPEGIEYMLSVELELLEAHNFTSVCMLEVGAVPAEGFPFECKRGESAVSLLNLFYDVRVGIGASGEPYVSYDAIVPSGGGSPYVASAAGVTGRVAEALADGTQGFVYRALLAGEGVADAEPTATAVQAFYRLGLPLAGYLNPQDEREEQEKLGDAVITDMETALFDRFGMKESFGRSAYQTAAVEELPGGGSVRVRWWSMPLQQAQWEGLSFKDLSWTILCIVCVYSYIAIHTRSLVMASVAMWEIVLSIFVAFFWHRLVFQVRFFQFINFLIVFVVLGIGADDVFVFIDAYRQSGAELRALGKPETLADRLLHTMRRASTAIFVTSLTTAAAFLATAITPLKPLQSFGIFSALVILCVLWMNLLIMPPMIVLYARNFENRTVGESMRALCGLWVCGKGAAPYEDPGLRLPDVATTGRGRTNDAATCHTESDSSKHTADTTSSQAGSRGRCETTSAPALDAASLRPLERFFYGPYSSALRKPIVRASIILAFTALLSVGIYLWTGIQPPSEPEEWFPSSHMMQQYQDIVSSKVFPQATGQGRVLEVNVLWGLERVSRKGVDPWDPADVGRVVYDDAFDPSTAAAQAHLMDAYAKLKVAPCGVRACTGGVLLNPNEHVLNIVAEYVDGTTEVAGGMYHWLRTVKGAQYAGAHPEDAPIVGNEFTRNLCEFSNLVSSKLKYPQHVGFDSDECSEANATFMLIEGVSSVRMPQAPRDFNEAQDEWNAWMGEMNAEAPPEMSRGVETSTNLFWLWSVTSITLVSTVYQGMSIVFPFVFVVLLLSTSNVWLALYSTLTILGIVVTVIGVGAAGLMGWDLGTAEIIAAVIIIGFSVDYCVHLANAYTESGARTRSSRMQIALTTMGISVTAGAITTVFAGVFLWLCILTFFVKFAFLIVWTICSSFAWAVLFFPALCMTIGPEGSQGDISPLKRKLYALACGRGKAAATDSA